MWSFPTMTPRVPTVPTTHSLRATALAATLAVALTTGAATAAAQPDAGPVGAGPAEVGQQSGEQGGAGQAGSPAVPGAPGGDDLVALSRLSEEAGALGEELHLAKAESDRARAELDRLERAAGVAAGRAALADAGAARDQSLVDHLAGVRFRGGDTGPTRAAVLADSPRDLVDRLGTLQRLSGTTARALDASRAASAEAARLREEAMTASGAARAAAQLARERADDLDRRGELLRGRIDEVRRRVDALTDAQRALWVGGPVMPPGYVAPPVDGANSAALAVGLTRLGTRYSWGATGPTEFDCSGLMVWSYAQEGKVLPRSSQAQAVAGAPVAVADVEPGDLVIYFPGATHVGMYAGDGLVLHAPTYGVPVRLERVDAMPISGIRRY